MPTPQDLCETSRRYYASHALEERERSRQYRADHKESELERGRCYREAHRAERREADRRRSRANHANEAARTATRKARRLGSFVEVVDRGILFERDGGMCGLCHVPVDPIAWHLDHIKPLAKGGAHSYANTQVTHPSCNLRKGTKYPSYS